MYRRRSLPANQVRARFADVAIAPAGILDTRAEDLDNWTSRILHQFPRYNGIGMVASADAKRHARRVNDRLRKAYPDAVCALIHHTPLELLIATILSAQCTDQRVNLVTESLFKKYHSASDFANAPIRSLERVIQSTGFFRSKARNIKACCQKLVEEFDGQVPREMEQLIQLPGVGRKTANVVLGTAFGISSGVVVDTHVRRISKRLGLTRHDDPEKIERDLKELLPKREWIDYSHRLIHHGRRVCLARTPRCDSCPIESSCPRVGVTVHA